MKKLSIILVSTALMGLVGCSSYDGNKDRTNRYDHHKTQHRYGTCPDGTPKAHDGVCLPNG